MSSLRKAANQNIQPAASGTEMLMFFYHHRAGSCKCNQSQPEALPVGRVHARLGRGGRGHQGQELSPPRQTPGQEKMMPNCAKTNKAQNHSFRQARLQGYCQGIFVGISKCPKSIDFEQKAWTIPTVLKMASDFGKCWKSSTQTL